MGRNEICEERRENWGGNDVKKACHHGFDVLKKYAFFFL